MKNIIYLTLAAFSLTVFAGPTNVDTKERTKKWEKTVEAPKVGKVRMKFAYAGEPLAKPADLTVYVKCDGMKKEIQTYYRDICWVNTYEYEKGDKALLFQVTTARVDNDSKVWCDQFTDEKIEVEKACQDAFAKGGK